MLISLYAFFTGSIDFSCTNINVEFMPEATTASFTIKVTKDKIFENRETFTIHLAETDSSKQLDVKLCANTSTGHIIDEGMNK